MLVQSHWYVVASFAVPDEKLTDCHSATTTQPARTNTRLSHELDSRLIGIHTAPSQPGFRDLLRIQEQLRTPFYRYEPADPRSHYPPLPALFGTREFSSNGTAGEMEDEKSKVAATCSSQTENPVQRAGSSATFNVLRTGRRWEWGFLALQLVDLVPPYMPIRHHYLACCRWTLRSICRPAITAF